MKTQLNDALNYNENGLTLYYQEKCGEAIAKYQNAIKFNQDFVYAYHNLAYTLEKRGRIQFRSATLNGDLV